MTDAVHIIAEAGTTHEGNEDTALQTVEAAARAGADSIKFQFIDPPGLYLERIREGNALVENPVIAPRRAQMLPPEAWQRIAARARALGLPFSASIFCRKTLAALLALDPPYIKLASADTANDALIEAAVATGKRVLLSTGMSGLGEIEHAVETLHRAGAAPDQVVLLHCVSIYPCPAERSNVAFVGTLSRAFGLPVGFSDHTETSVAAIAAIALGARWIEKHMTLDRKAKGFDHAYAMEPAMLAAYIADLRAAEAALRPQSPKVGETEAGVKQRARRGLWAIRDLPAGHVIRAEDVLAVRPAGPLTPADLSGLIGRRLARPVLTSAPFRLEDLE